MIHEKAVKASQWLNDFHSPNSRFIFNNGKWTHQCRQIKGFNLAIGKLTSKELIAEAESLGWRSE